MSDSTPFFDDDRSPQLCDCLCLFVDILGYSERIRSAFANDTWEEEFERFHTIIHRNIREIFQPRWFEQERRQWEVKIFTDNIVLGHNLYSGHGENEFGGVVIQATAYQAALAQSGYFVRGGMARGMLYMDEMTAYGPALLDAYELESRTAVVPRIILSSSVLEMAEAHTNFYSEPDDSPQNHFIMKDRYGIGFLNYLYHYAVDSMDEYELQIDLIGRHKGLIIANLEDRTLPPRVREKYEWLAQYQNHYFRRFEFDESYTVDLLIPSEYSGHQFFPLVPDVQPEDE